MRGLYAIADVATLAARGLEPVAFGAAVLRARPAALQIRAKGVGARETLGWLRALVPLCRRAGVPLVANDRADLAALAGCDFVHVGQDDLSVAQVRRLAPGLRVGVSTHDEEQVARALAAGADYVAFGPVFATSSKSDSSPVVGLAGLRAACAQVAPHGVPLVAIGGITIERAPSIASVANAGAVIAALLDGGLDASSLVVRASALHEALGGATTPPVQATA